LTPGFPQNNPQAAASCLWKRGAGSPSAEVFPQIWNERLISADATLTPLRARKNAGSSLVKPHAGRASVGYPSPVCSNVGDAIDRVTAAIDQLASDAHGDASEPELTARIAGLWQMVSQLDPELARRAQGYAEPSDDALPD
jgi:hypothetical protein